MAINAVSNFAANIANFLNISVQNQETNNAGRVSSSEVLSTAASGLDLSNADFGTILLKDRIYNQGYGYTLVQIKADKLDELYTHLNNLKYTNEQVCIF